jgi:ABC-type proline/glycine betaine transport system ATPase subunit
MEKYSYLSEEQRNIIKVLSSSRNFGILISKAGSEKITTMKAIVNIYKQSNAKVIGMSLLFINNSFRKSSPRSCNC